MTFGSTDQLRLPAAHLLGSIDFSSYELPKGIRHPLAQYNRSMAFLLENFLICSKYQRIFNTDDLKEYFRDYDSLLDSIMEHIDACESVVEIIFRLNGRKPGKGTRAFRSNTISYTGLVRQIVNAIKHQQSNLNPCTYSSLGMSVHGYWIDHSADGETLVVHPEIHGGQPVAISFARDLRCHLVGLFYISSTICELSSQFGYDDCQTTTVAGSKECKIAEIVKSVSAWPTFVFPDEEVKAWPSVSYEQNDGAVTILIDVPSLNDRPSTFDSGSFTGGTSGDGVTRSFQMPYMGSDVQNYLRKLPR